MSIIQSKTVSQINLKTVARAKLPMPMTALALDNLYGKWMGYWRCDGMITCEIS